MSFTEKDITEARQEAAKAIHKIMEANDAMNRLYSFKEKMDQERKDLDARKQTLDTIEKRLQYMKLRLLKLIDEKQLDQDLKKLIEEACRAE